MYITELQTRLRFVKDEETNKYRLEPSKRRITINEFDEFEDDSDIEHVLKHQIAVHANQMKISEEQAAQYFRLKEIETDGKDSDD
jgi:hypothetical protein